jgi:hypothetical protein
MPTVDKPENSESDDEQARADLYLMMPIDQRDQQRERQDNDEHREEMAGR